MDEHEAKSERSQEDVTGDPGPDSGATKASAADSPEATDDLQQGKAGDALAWLEGPAFDSPIEEMPTLQWPDVEAEAREAQELGEDAARDAAPEPSAAGGEGEGELEDAMQWLEELAREQGTPLDEMPTLISSGDRERSETAEELPELGATTQPPQLDSDPMAWLEQLAIDQNSPLEELPSVADRLLASEIASQTAFEHEEPPEPLRSQPLELEAALRYLEEQAAAEGVSLEDVSYDEDEAVDYLDDELVSVDRLAAVAALGAVGAERGEGQEEEALEPQTLKPDDAAVPAMQQEADPQTAAAVQPEAEAQEQTAAQEDAAPPEEESTPLATAGKVAAAAKLAGELADKDEEESASAGEQPLDPPLEEAPEAAEAVTIAAAGRIAQEDTAPQEEVTEVEDAATQEKIAVQEETRPGEETSPLAKAGKAAAAAKLADEFVQRDEKEPDSAEPAVTSEQEQALHPPLEEAPEADEAVTAAAIGAAETEPVPQVPAEDGRASWLGKAVAAAALGKAADMLIDDEEPSAPAAGEDAPAEMEETAQEGDILDAMPDDPDEAMAWMGAMAQDEEAGETEEEPAQGGGEPLLDEDVLDGMPDDPDEAMKWMAALAAKEAVARHASAAPQDDREDEESPAEGTPSEEALEAGAPQERAQEPSVEEEAGFASGLHAAQEALEAEDLPAATQRYRALLETGQERGRLITELQAAVQSRPAEPALRELLGDAYMQDGQVQKALKTYQEGLTNN